jgi:hypothetical protein
MLRDLGPSLDTPEPIPSTTLLLAQEAKDRLRQIVEGFFFRRLTTAALLQKFQGAETAFAANDTLDGGNC